MTLWCYDESSGVWNHRRLDCCSSVCSGADQRGHQSSASLASVREIHWLPHKGPVMWKMFPFDDAIMSWSVYLWHRRTLTEPRPEYFLTHLSAFPCWATEAGNYLEMDKWNFEIQLSALKYEPMYSYYQIFHINNYKVLTKCPYCFIIWFYPELQNTVPVCVLTHSLLVMPRGVTNLIQH